MKVRKNIEAVFLATAVLATFATYAIADEPAVYAGAPIASTAAVATSPMQVVVIKGHRLSAAEKANLS